MMKTKFLTLIALCLATFTVAQESNLLTAAVSYFDVKGLNIDAEQAGSLARKELMKTGKYRVLDRYDMEYLAEQQNTKLTDCFGRLCLIEVGKKLKVDHILTGSIELYEERIVVSLRLIDIGKEEIIQTELMEFLDLRQQISAMLQLSIEKMLGIASDQTLVNKLTKKYDYSNKINTPETDKLSLNGPRMGVTYISGNMGEYFAAPRDEGGYDAMPVMFQFGYQFEAQYLNQGNFQALFEFIPIITGLDQGLFIPSVSILNGMRSNKNGWELAFGPIIYLTKEARGYYDENQVWHLEKEWFEENPGVPLPYETERRFDSRGGLGLVSNFVFGVGKTLKSGNLNIPINFFFIPNKDGHRFGLSVGYNTSSRK